MQSNDRSKFENRQFYLPHCHLALSLRLIPFEFLVAILTAETRVNGLPYGEDLVFLRSFASKKNRLLTYGQTDGQTQL